MKKGEGKLGRTLIGMMIFIIVLTLFLVWLINNTFLEGFYLADKESSLRDVFSEMESATTANRLYEMDYQIRLDDISAMEGISSIVIRPDGTILVSSRVQADSILRRLFNVVFGSDPMDSYEEGPYSLRRFSDIDTGEDYLTLWGSLPDGNTVYIETAIAPLQDTVALTNRFLVIAGCAAIAIGIALSLLLTGKILKPLRQLTDISERMSRMDFDVKYEPVSNNEIDTLGLRMNEMSSLIEGYIRQLKQANTQLHRDIRRREESELMRREFISNVSHELKTPISLIMGYADGLEAVSDDPGERDYYTSVIIDEAEKMDALIRRLMELNELEYGTEQIQMARVDLGALIHEEVYSVMLLARNAGVRIQTLGFDSPTYVWTDEFLARQVVDNYLTNAIRYAEGEKLVKVGISREDERVVFTVYNTGPGIPEEYRDRIWDKFYKIDPARTREKSGSGLGLSIVKAAADTLESSYGSENKADGVEFYFTFDSKEI